MKKYIFMAVAGMLALSSCSNDDNDEPSVQNDSEQMTFTASFSDYAQTRASLYNNMKKVKFDAFDMISIFSEKNTNMLFTTELGGASATFTGTATPDSKFYAVYPFKAGYTFNRSTGVISGVLIPNDQSAAATSDCGWDDGSAIAYATTTGSSLKFHNACALLKVTNNVDATAQIVVKADNYNVAGTFELNTETGALTETSGQYEVIVNDVPYNKTIYIAIKPGAATGYIATWVAGGTTRAKARNTSFTFEAGKIYDMGKASDWPVM